MRLDHDEEDYSLSLSRFESMLKTNKVFFFDSEEFEEIILHYLDTGKINLAKKALKLGLEQHPKSTGLKLVQVEMLIYEDKIDMAEKLLNELYVLEPNNDEIFIQKANIYSKRDDHKKAVEFLYEALKRTDDLADVYNLLGMEYLFMDNLEKAKENFILCLEDDIEDQSALYNVVYCFEFLDQYREAITYLKNYIDKNPYSEIAWHQKGRLYYSLNDYENAVRCFELATYIDEYFLGAYLEKGKSLEKLNRYEEAIESYRQTMELDDPTSYALLRIGKCHEKLGNKKEALDYYNKTVHEDPLLDKGWITITNFYIKLKEFQKALYHVNKALGIDNQNPEYWKKYAAINNALNFFEEAEYGYRKAIENGDDDLDTWLFWVDLLLEIGEWENALYTLHQAEEQHKNSAEIEMRLVGFYYTLGNNTLGKNYLEKVLKSSKTQIYILKELFPDVYELNEVQKLIKKYKN